VPHFLRGSEGLRQRADALFYAMKKVRIQEKAAFFSTAGSFKQGSSAFRLRGPRWLQGPRSDSLERLEPSLSNREKYRDRESLTNNFG
jgi:hypothetical protein